LSAARRSVRGAARIALAALAALASCRDLPAVPRDTCGNGVVEAPEDCDTFAPSAGSVCLPRGAPGQCHLDCRRRADGSVPSCPTGWGCAVQGICRPPTGALTASVKSSLGGASSLLAGDFDGDGRADVVTLEPLDGRGRTRLRFHYFDETGALTETRSFAKLLASPVIADLSGDGRSDVAFTDFRVGLLVGQSDRSWVPETFSSYHFPDATVRMLGVYDDQIQDISAVVVLTTLAGVPGLYVPDEFGILRRRGELPGPIDALVGEPVTGDLIDDPIASPCRELVLAVRDATSFWMVDTCTRADVVAPIAFRDRFDAWEVPIDPPASIDAAPQITDMDGDGHLDVLLGAGGRVYVAYGDGAGLSAAIPYRLPLANPAMVSPDIPMPLAAGDFTGDGAVDFVFEDHLLISHPSGTGQLPTYLPDRANEGAPWTVARIADFNGNGKPDVVAASSGRLGIDFFNGTGTPQVPAFSLATRGPVRLLTVGDFDGDLIEDLAFVEAAPTESDPDDLLIAFGSTSGAPAPPAPVARIHHAEELSTVTENQIGNLLVASSETVAGAQSGVIAVLAGSGDRLPFAPYQLVSVSTDSSVFNSAALAMTYGGFTAAGHGDVLVLSTDGDPNHHDWQFWLLPALQRSESAAMRIGTGQLDPRLRPAYVDAYHVVVNVTGAAGDLDGDGRDEAIWAMPADGNTRCGLAIVGVTAGDVPRVVPGVTIFLDQPCSSPQVAVVDVDGDGALDIALLTGALDDLDRKLVVLWNDGAGGFTGARLASVSPIGDSPQQFTVLPASLDRRLGFAYVTDAAVALVTAAAERRQFDPPHALLPVRHGTGIVAADVNGDGVVDLAVAASDNLLVLEAQLAP
jgi:FG-GAP-like repeat